jgi:hypothetical protein
MFIQIMEGATSRPDALRAQLDRWVAELAPGAQGWLGSTTAIDPSGDVVLTARFESAEAARRNSDRDEQGEWWAETEATFDGEVRFRETEDAHVMQHGDVDAATFVQVMDGRVADAEAARSLNDRAADALRTARPDLLGSVIAFFDDGTFTELAYFTSEADARAAENGEMPPEMAEMVAEFQRVMPVDRYRDISDPLLSSPT